MGTGVLIGLVLSCLLCCGCLGLRYQVGTKSLFGQDIQTVYVPIFETDESHYHLAERLTEAVCKRIEARSPYKVVDRPTADSTLQGRIVNRRQYLSLVNNYSDPRQKLFTLSVEIKWHDRRDRELSHFEPIPWKDGSGQTASSAFQVAEYGQSEATTEQQEIDALADQIVGMMEMPW